MKTLALTLIATVLTAMSLADDKPVLRLNVYPVHAVTPMEVHSIITNVSDKPVTIPTSTYSGGASGWAQGSKKLGIIFDIGFNSAGDQRLVPSPFRFFPVVLSPGESTELPLIHARHEGEETVEVIFTVEKEFAERFGWWSGTLKKKVVIGQGANPYICPLDTEGVEGAARSAIETSAATPPPAP